MNRKQLEHIIRAATVIADDVMMNHQLLDRHVLQARLDDTALEPALRDLVRGRVDRLASRTSV